MVDLNKDKLNMGEWRNLPFSEAVLINPTVRLERGIVYPFVDMAAVHASSRWAYANKQRKYAGGGSRFQGGDTLMARITPCLENGKIARYRSTDTITTAYGSTEFIVIRGRPNVTDTEFAYYLTRWSEVRTYAISQMTGTSGRQRVPTSTLDYIYVPIPPLPEQRVIAHILGTLDDKIELNRRMNKTLEEMARAIFKSWFVDFDPVRAKMDGSWRRGESLPGMPAEMYDLFPSRLVDSELGEIPEGWEVSEIGREVEVVGGGTPSTKDMSFWDGGNIHWATPKDLSRLQSLILIETERKITSVGLKKISSGLLPVGTVLMSSRAPVSYLAIAQVPLAVNQGFIAMKCDERISREYTLFWCSENMNIIKAHASGTTFQEISKRNFRLLKVLVPTTGVLRVFDNMVNSLFERITLNLHESRTLAGLRDTLLPKLISGELRVGDAEGFVESTV